jgi:hypothetical protein
MNEYNYTISSKYSDDYSYVKTSLHPPPTHMSELIVNNLTTQHSFRTLNTDDYIVLSLDGEDENRTYQVDRNYSNLTMSKLSAILNKMMNPEFIVYYDYENRFMLYTKPMKPYTIIDMSYNFQILTGTLQTKFPISSRAVHSWIAPQQRYLDIDENDYLRHGTDYFYIWGTRHSTHYYRGPPIKLSTITDYKLQEIMRKMLDHGNGANYPDIAIRFTNLYNHDPNDKYEYFVLLRDDKPIDLVYLTPNLAKIVGSIRQHTTFTLQDFYPSIPSSVYSGIHYCRSDSVGYFNLTPVLYLMSNLGTSCYSNEITIDEKTNDRIHTLDNRKIAMRINNYFINGLPIIANNIEFTSTVPSSSLTNVWFRLVDSNYQPVKLLTPMEISIAVIGIEEKPIQMPLYKEDNLL